MNKMREVAKLLGLEWDEEKQESEEFGIEDVKGKFKFNKKTLFDVYNDITYSSFVGYLLTEEYVIIEKSLKPKISDWYWSSNIMKVNEVIWQNNEIDNYRYDLGLVYKTMEEAKIRHAEIIEFLKSTKGAMNNETNQT